ncbi:MAG: cytochrome c [Sneathiella sp.]|nr:cytochrome c [Sneathiella sp.]
MKKILSVVGTLAVLGAISTSVFAVEFEREIKARQSVMQIYAFNLGILGAMAKGEKEYEAGLAQTAANNLNAAILMNNGAMWPMGSDMSAPGLAGKTRAKANIWTSFPKVVETHKSLAVASAAMADVAGTGLTAIRSNIGAVGKGCQSCHEAFRAPKK